MARVLGLRGCLVPTSSTTTPERETDIPEIPIVADVAGLEFYVDFAVPRLAATMAEGGNQADTSLREGGDLTPGSVAVMGLRELAAVHLQESGESPVCCFRRYLYACVGVAPSCMMSMVESDTARMKSATGTT